MASVFRRDGSWVVKWKDGAGRWRQERTDLATKAEAHRYAIERERRGAYQRAGVTPLDAPSRLTLNELLDWHEKEFGPEQRSKSDRLVANRHVRPSLGSLALVDVTTARIDQLLTSKRDELSPKTLNNLRAYLQGVFSKAIRREQWNGANPAINVPRRKVPHRVPSYLRPDEVRAMLAKLPDNWRGFFATAVYTGMRRGEIAALQKRDVDLDAGTITVSRSWDSETTKGGKARLIPLHPELKPYLQRAIDESPSSVVFARPDGAMQLQTAHLPRLLRSSLNRAGLVEEWKLKCRRCGHHEKSKTSDAKPCPECGFSLWPSPVPRRVRFHDLRHTTATLMLKAGVSLAVVQRVLGHSSPLVTSEVYGHLDLDDMRVGLSSLSFSPAEAAPSAPEKEPATAPLRLVANEENARHGAPVVRTRRDDEDAPRVRARISELSREVEVSGPTRIRTWNQAVMSPELGSSHGLSPLVAPSLPLGEQTSAAPSSIPPVRTISTQANGRGAPVVRDLTVLLSVREVAERLSVSRATVYSLINRGELERVWVVTALRVTAASLAAFLEKGAT